MQWSVTVRFLELFILFLSEAEPSYCWRVPIAALWLLSLQKYCFLPIYSSSNVLPNRFFFSVILGFAAFCYNLAIEICKGLRTHEKNVYAAICTKYKSFRTKHEGLALTLTLSRLYKNVCIHMIQFSKMYNKLPCWCDQYKSVTLLYQLIAKANNSVLKSKLQYSGLGLRWHIL